MSDQSRHLKGSKDSQSDPVDWRGTHDPPDPTASNLSSNESSSMDSVSQPVGESAQHLSGDSDIELADSDPHYDPEANDESGKDSGSSFIDDDEAESSDSGSSDSEGDQMLIDENRQPAYKSSTTLSQNITYATVANEKSQKNNENQQKTPKKTTPGAGSKSSLHDKVREKEMAKMQAEMRNDVTYIIRCIKDSLVGPKFAYARNALDRFEQKQPIESQLMHLGDLPLNNHSLKADLNNPNELTQERIYSIMQEWCEARIDQCKKQCETLKNTIINAEHQNNELVKQLETDVAGDFGEDKQRRLETLEDIMIESKRQLVIQGQDLMAYRLIPNGRIIENKIYYEASMEPNTIVQMLENFGIPKGSGIKPKSINERMMEILTTVDFASEKVDTDYFSFKQSLRINGTYMLVELAYKPNSAAREYLERNFLHPKDRIINWFDDYTRSSSTRMVSTVSVDLGTDQTPPKRLVRGIYAMNQLETCKDIQDNAKRHKGTQDFIKSHPVFSKAPIMQRVCKKIDLYLKDEEKRFEAEEEIRCELVKTPPHLKVHDPLAMTVDIQFIQRYCPLCHTTDHSFKECTKKGCSLCGKDYHPDYFCKKKCNCGRRPYHLPDNCPANARPFAQPKLIRKQSESQVTAKTSVNTAKNSENRKNHNIFDKLPIAEEEHTTMDIEPTESESQDTAVVTQSEDMDTEPDSVESNIEDDIEKTRIIHRQKIQRGPDGKQAIKAHNTATTPIAVVTPNGNTEKGTNPDSPERVRKSATQTANSSPSRRLGGLINSPRTTPQRGSHMRSTPAPSSGRQVQTSPLNRHIPQSASVIDIIANSGEISPAKEKDRHHPRIPSDEGSSRGKQSPETMVLSLESGFTMRHTTTKASNSITDENPALPGRDKESSINHSTDNQSLTEQLPSSTGEILQNRTTEDSSSNQ
ncbi:hypothetical protein JCM33374_g2828 [Metschnikowia sp. JCM 33374]|nr:hypothetical protein JCM33374_g2828 [Metschnikowia sp. JCM 33374]